MAVDHNTKVMMQRAEARRETEQLIEARRQANASRLRNNLQILTLLAKFMGTREDLRFCQVLNILGLDKDRFYEEPQDTLQLLEKRIAELEAMIENVVIIKDVKSDKVSIGTSVELKYLEDGETEVYAIVGSKEADPFANKISNESPIAKAIMGLSKGTIVSVDSPNGKYDVEIIDIF